MSVSVEILQGEHQHPIPRGMAKLLRRLCKVAGLKGRRQVKHGAVVKGTAHLRGVSSVGPIGRESTIELRCQPGGNESARRMFFLLQGNEDPEEMCARLERAAARLGKEESGRGRTIKRRTKAPVKVPFRELLARTKPEGGAEMKQDKQDKAGEAKALSPVAVSEGAAPSQGKVCWVGSPADDIEWVKKAGKAFLARADERRQLLQALFATTIIDGTGLNVSLRSFRPTGCALVNRGYFTRVHRGGDTAKGVVAYEATEKLVALVRGPVEMVAGNEDAKISRRLANLAALEEKARPALDCEEMIASVKANIARLTSELASEHQELAGLQQLLEDEPEEAKQARELLRILDGETEALDVDDVDEGNKSAEAESALPQKATDTDEGPLGYADEEV
ncbi:MAG: hypothetical protein COV10_04270 [Candidatus Vogelbacteria bacterium CG10_big_fil_rev_8_21_14_0_10_51_16]|uniref:Uncharacterized protein n=1 Tax=Candidatus Vogelbacteria bacterium CG10_big_fil_rev_8_21_14_0_10_51_16 TaxID=1975045 RepID=A0A2H0RDU6_9BACT|nr:MAG: hypothetical protein COV10_04270 [Candidatus Vogelbacteria bacterium CG10_big_fil_rev_8_21_14_0_10_51_16]